MCVYIYTRAIPDIYSLEYAMCSVVTILMYCFNAMLYIVYRTFIGYLLLLEKNVFVWRFMGNNLPRVIVQNIHIVIMKINKCII